MHGSLRFSSSSTIAQRTVRGFTLIELMIVVVVIAILSAVAYPAYTDYVIRSRIPDATSVLSASQVKMEQFFQDSHTFTNGTACTTALPTATASFKFTCSIDSTGMKYTMTATGQGTMKDFEYSVDQDNARKTTSVPVSKGWAYPPAGTNCWVTKKGGVC